VFDKIVVVGTTALVVVVVIGEATGLTVVVVITFGLVVVEVNAFGLVELEVEFGVTVVDVVTELLVLQLLTVSVSITPGSSSIVVWTVSPSAAAKYPASPDPSIKLETRPVRWFLNLACTTSERLFFTFTPGPGLQLSTTGKFGIAVPAST